MSNIILCTICLALGNFGVAAFRDVPNFMEAGTVTWHQFVAILIYQVIWIKE